MRSFFNNTLLIAVLIYLFIPIKAIAKEVNLLPPEHGPTISGVSNEDALHIVTIAREAFPALNEKQIVSVKTGVDGYVLVPEQSIIVDMETRTADITESYVISRDFDWVEKRIKDEDVKRFFVTIGGRI